MPTVLNLLPEESTKFLTTTGSWVSSTNDLSVTRSTVRPESNSSSLRVYVSSGTAASAMASIQEIPNTYYDWPLRAFAWVNSDKSEDVTIYLTYVVGGASTTVSAVTSVIADNWTLLSVQQDLVPSSVSNVTVVLAPPTT